MVAATPLFLLFFPVEDDADAEENTVCRPFA
jgi:hypothetical protein